MDLSGIIFVVLAVAWAVYLIPKALKHHDEVARTRSVERFSNAMRVLARREPVNRRDTRLVVTPPRPAGSPRVIPPAARAATSDLPTPSPAPPASAASSRSPRSGSRPERAAARAAARRRRHILLALLLADAAVVAVAAFTLVPWWSVAIPSALTLLYLILCRTQVRRQSEAVWAPAAVDTDGAVAPRRAIRVDAPYGNPRRPAGPDEEETVTLSSASLRAAAGASSLAEAEAAAVHADQQQTVAVTVTTVDGESLWDPLPVTLPTYVGKAKAARTVRTIDLNGPDAWTSGRTAEDSRLVEEANASASAPSEDAAPEQRAVGS
ncbi:MAG TPA: hypothetical protein VFJ09_01630 [Nocardioidaceae bacterium]|nr:hypothetical protein [Nocardioidaceae bacterium]